MSVAGKSGWDLSPGLWAEVTADAPDARSKFHPNWAGTSLTLHLRPDLDRTDVPPTGART